MRAYQRTREFKLSITTFEHSQFGTFNKLHPFIYTSVVTYALRQVDTVKEKFTKNKMSQKIYKDHIIDKIPLKKLNYDKKKLIIPKELITIFKRSHISSKT